MKVLHVNTNDTGGAAIAAIRLHYLMLEKGIDSNILFLKRSGKSEVRAAYYFEDLYKGQWFFKLMLLANSAYNRRSTFYKSSVYFNGPDSLFDFSRHELFRSADVVHLHWVVKFLDWKKVFKHLHKKFVWTLHDMNPFTGGEHYETGYNNDFPRSSSINKKRKVAYLKNVQLSIITPSRWMETLARQSAVFAGKEIKTVRNPVDLTTFNIKKSSVREKYGISPNKKIILFVAENPQDKRKGFDLLLSSLEKVRNKDGFHLLVIGDSRNMPATLFSHTFAGSVHNESLMAEIYSSADLFIIPSREDNLPNTVSESFLCGTPVAGFHTGGIPEMVKEGLNGYLCHDSQGLAEAIENIQVSSFDKNKVRESAILELDPEKLYAEFMEIYQS